MNNSIEDNCAIIEGINAENNFIVSYTITQVYNNLVDLFFLYLLHRYSKRCQQEDNTSLSSAVIAHDHDEASVNFTASLHKQE